MFSLISLAITSTTSAILMAEYCVLQYYGYYHFSCRFRCIAARFISPNYSIIAGLVNGGVKVTGDSLKILNFNNAY